MSVVGGSLKKKNKSLVQAHTNALTNMSTKTYFVTLSAIRWLVVAGESVRWSVGFFFSSRRRHTSLQGDWSSDVCSSDLADEVGHQVRKRHGLRASVGLPA